ncbi:hypothetical protein MBSD_n0670 [Mizugakiibacter sediminis]|uniref:Uncharacterized protein n=1 Tax=Mizugakiibacter sediminis TaxID=1475481 RepID=A0A0K8QL15_9GAMM|nr:hypothetical protein [Mizugakiibacter sediminis]GAP65381.1 hypothetical protein MBSD_n0670 [Mizugakiibacter sediminis]
MDRAGRGALAALDGGKLHPQPDAELRAALAQWQGRLRKARGSDTVAVDRREARTISASTSATRSR